MSTSASKIYTYLWLREDGTPYYAGKGTEKRARRCGSPPGDRVILQEWPSEEMAFEGECLLIAYYGRIDLGTGYLQNLTDGGKGAAGAHFPMRKLPKSPEHRVTKLSAVRLRYWDKVLQEHGQGMGRGCNTRKLVYLAPKELMKLSDFLAAKRRGGGSRRVSPYIKGMMLYQQLTENSASIEDEHGEV